MHSLFDYRELIQDVFLLFFSRNNLQFCFLSNLILKLLWDISNFPEVKMPCTYCDVQFSVLKWKTRCNYCSRKYCSDCIVEGKCKSCYQVSSTNFQRSQLSRLKVKDLRLYLENRNCSTATLKEKSEFITTIQQLQGNHEPEYANMHLYNTHYSTHHQQTVTNQMQGAPYHNIPTEDCMMQGFDPPTYEHTQ